MLEPEIYKAIECCLSRGIPFAAWAQPQAPAPAFISAPSASTRAPQGQPDGFFVCDFAQPFAASHWIPAELDARQTLLHCQGLAPVSAQDANHTLQPTMRDDYMAACSELIRRLRARGNAKTVLSTLQIAELPQTSAAEIFASLVEAMPAAMRFCYYHPSTGCWLGATPELLLRADGATGQLATMALAGTSATGQWDAKNAHEHQVVVDFICQTLRRLGIDPVAGQRATQRYGNFCHLRTDICGSLGSVSTVDVLDALNPTPALCGYPRDAALRDIAELEQHSRQCYGGCIGWRSGALLTAYVNIRSAQLLGGQCIMRVGGGIMPDSSPEAEWEEVMLKRQAIIGLMAPPNMQQHAESCLSMQNTPKHD